mmetsp:Transcript_71425/g.209368  ORF Transcript_71425/g.209368 Transcript_71425/m.209368 type:complete len:236 (+) Transcript_71425:1036-1743(+)
MRQPDFDQAPAGSAPRLGHGPGHERRRGKVAPDPLLAEGLPDGGGASPCEGAAQQPQCPGELPLPRRGLQEAPDGESLRTGDDERAPGLGVAHRDAERRDGHHRLRGAHLHLEQSPLRVPGRLAGGGERPQQQAPWPHPRLRPGGPQLVAPHVWGAPGAREGRPGRRGVLRRELLRRVRDQRVRALQCGLEAPTALPIREGGGEDRGGQRSAQRAAGSVGSHGVGETAGRATGAP